MKQPIKRGRVMSEINITPFTDVVLVLLIIFMITTPLLLQPGIKIKLPTAQSAETDTSKVVNIIVNPSGEIFVENKKINIDDLKSEISMKLYGNPEQPVIVKADKEVKYDIVIKVLDAAKQSGAKKFALGVEMQEAKK